MSSLADTSASPPIVARGLVARYGELVAVDGIDLEARAGTCLGLLGPNGAGKTTTIEILEGLRPPQGGEVSILGLSWQESARKIRHRIGVLLQQTDFQDRLQVRETLRLFRSFYDRGRDIDDVLALVGLQDKKGARVMTLSGGQKQRLAVGCALVSEPEVLFLDEPTSGLDPQARRRVWEIVEEFKAGGGTVLLTTHYMDEAEKLADDLIILDHGKVIATGSPSRIIRTLEAESIVEFTLAIDGEGPAPALEKDALRALDGVRDIHVLGEVYTLTVTDTRGVLSGLLSFLEERRILTEDIRTHRPTLEDVFVALTGKHLRDE